MFARQAITRAAGARSFSTTGKYIATISQFVVYFSVPANMIFSMPSRLFREIYELFPIITCSLEGFCLKMDFWPSIFMENL